MRNLLLCCQIQGVVIYMSPVEAFATTIKFFDRQKVCLISRVKGHMHSWLLIFSSLEVILIPWSAPKRALITWFNFDPSRKCFYMGHISDYPLRSVLVVSQARPFPFRSADRFLSAAYWKRSALRNGKGLACETTSVTIHIYVLFYGYSVIFL